MSNTLIKGDAFADLQWKVLIFDQTHTHRDSIFCIFMPPSVFEWRGFLDVVLAVLLKVYFVSLHMFDVFSFSVLGAGGGDPRVR